MCLTVEIKQQLAGLSSWRQWNGERVAWSFEHIEVNYLLGWMHCECYHYRFILTR